MLIYLIHNDVTVQYCGVSKAKGTANMMKMGWGLHITPFSNWQICRVHDDVIKLKHCPRYWPFVRGIHRSPVNSPHKGQWRGAFIFSLICAWTNSRANKGDAGDFRRYRGHYDVIVRTTSRPLCPDSCSRGGMELVNTLNKKVLQTHWICSSSPNTNFVFLCLNLRD